jgi:hypothetical protein
MASSQMQAHPAASLYSLLSPDPMGKAADSTRQPAAPAGASLPKLGDHWRAAQMAADDTPSRTGGVDTRFEARAGFHAFAPSIATHSAAFSAPSSSASSTVSSGTSVRVSVGHSQVVGEGTGKPGVLSTRSPSSPSSFFSQPEAQVCIKFCIGYYRREEEEGWCRPSQVNVWTSTSL